MPTLSMICNVYNEAEMMPYVEPLLSMVDQAVFAEGGPIGASIDGTGAIVSALAEQHRHVKAISDTYRRAEDGGYDSARMRNSMVEQCTCDFILYHHADIVYGDGSFAMLRDAIDKFPDVDIFYSPLYEFFYDLRHLRLYPAVEEMHPRPLCGDSLVYKASAGVRFRQRPYTGLYLEKSWDGMNTQFLPDVKRFHLAFVRPFDLQVEKHVRRITQRDWGDVGEPLLLDGFDAVFEAALGHVETYPRLPMFDYFGICPESIKGKDYCSMDGRQKFYDSIERYRERYSRYYGYEYYHSANYERWN